MKTGRVAKTKSVTILIAVGGTVSNSPVEEKKELTTVEFTNS
jgi:hypothetical protein